ncbi:hypothetical protein 1 [Wenzhou tombus-like virus 3]|uniref:hypothetical protein 1 n=1 Tax=Wenzhou tombus-like virus 3 TaxID=1923673 RepID=UPI00090CBD47|nr:hypothetical protein 1 [Wenzhou tombus-like virus 3]APG76616.1 hypothetical protein 1 [Wenzhou tombus-like virus 3]
MCILILLCVAFLALVFKLVYRSRESVYREDVDRFDRACEGGEIPDGRVFTRLAFEAACACKEKYGEMRYNNANRIVVGEFVREYLRKTYPDLRVVDRIKHATYAVELALLPMKSAVVAQEFAADVEVVGRRTAGYATR